MNVALTGYRSAGKTTLGSAAAARLGLRFIDLDDVVLEHFDHATVADVWRLEGEEAWRTAEAHALAEALDCDGTLVALGGGVLTRPGPRRRIDADRAAGRLFVIYLECSAEVLKERLAAEQGDRPSLTGADLVAEVDTVLPGRIAAYQAVADECVDVGVLNEPAAIDALTQYLRTAVCGRQAEYPTDG